MTRTPQDYALEHAESLLRESAESLRLCFCINGIPQWEDEPEALEAYEDYLKAADGLAKLRAAPQPGWISVDERLPEAGKPVLLDIGKKYPIRAMWTAKFTLAAVEHDADWGEYNEATDAYYCPEGWYEWNEHEEVHWRVHADAVAWLDLPLPLPPFTKGESTNG